MHPGSIPGGASIYCSPLAADTWALRATSSCGAASHYLTWRHASAPFLGDIGVRPHRPLARMLHEQGRVARPSLAFAPDLSAEIASTMPSGKIAVPEESVERLEAEHGQPCLLMNAA